jgi:hypothetical protein
MTYPICIWMILFRHFKISLFDFTFIRRSRNPQDFVKISLPVGGKASHRGTLQGMGLLCSVLTMIRNGIYSGCACHIGTRGTRRQSTKERSSQQRRGGSRSKRNGSRHDHRSIVLNTMRNRLSLTSLEDTLSFSFAGIS